MEEKNTLRSIVTANWDIIARTLELNIENKPEYMLLMLSHLRPILDSAAAAFPRPSIATYVSVKDEYKKHLIILEKMGFADCKSYEDSFGLTLKGVNLIDRYHKSINPDYVTNSEMTANIIKLSGHLYET